MRSNKPYTNVTFTKRVDHSGGSHRGSKAKAGTGVCQTCGAVYLRRRWVAGGTPQAQLIARTGPIVLTTCEACHMVAEGTWRGELRVSGEFFVAHHEEFERLLRNEVARSLIDNPLARIVRWTPHDRDLTVTTTTEHLAKRLGQALKKAFDGTVHYEFSHENKFAHVSWQR